MRSRGCEQSAGSASRIDKVDERLSGKPITKSPARRTLEHLAEYSPEHATMLRALKTAEAENRRQRSIMEWCAEVLSGGGAGGRNLRGTEDPDVGHSGRSPGRALFEQDWDPAQHPRAPKGQPDGGQWVGKGDSVGTRGGFDHGAMGVAPELGLQRTEVKPRSHDLLVLAAN